MEILLGIAVAFLLGTVINYFSGVVEALSEIYLAAASPLPLILTGLVAVGIGWLGIEIWQAAVTPGERLAGGVVVSVGAWLTLVGGAVWRQAKDARTPDHEPRG